MNISDILLTINDIDYSHMMVDHSIDPISIARYMVTEAPLYLDGEQSHGHDSDEEFANAHKGMGSFNNHKVNGYHWMIGRARNGALLHALVDVDKNETVAFIQSVAHEKSHKDHNGSKDAFELKRAWVHPDVRGMGLVEQMILQLYHDGFSIISGDSLSTPARKMMDRIRTKLLGQGVEMRYYNIETGEYIEAHDYKPNEADIRYVFETKTRPRMTNTILFETRY